MKALPLKTAFESKVRVTPGCWLWLGALDRRGYGRMTAEKRRGTLAHRVSHELYIGPIQAGYSVMHKCDNPQCVNPDHLRAGTHQENMLDKDAKGRRAPSPTQKLSADQVRAIYSDKRQQSVIAAEFNVAPNTVSQIKSRKIWAHLSLEAA